MNKNKNIKSEKGGVTITVLAAMCFVLTVVLISYMGISNKQQAELANMRKIKAVYEKDVTNIEAIYNSVI